MVISGAWWTGFLGYNMFRFWLDRLAHGLWDAWRWILPGGPGVRAPD